MNQQTTIDANAILPLIMKLSLPIGCLLFAAMPSMALADGKREHPLPGAEPVLSVLPVAADNAEARSTVSLRQSLRQPLDGVDDKPFRMSSQERQRLREQLRSQSAPQSAVNR